MDSLSEPVDGISVARVGNMYNLVDLDRCEFVDTVFRTYVGSMTRDGWALIQENTNPDDQRIRYNYINAKGDKLSSRGFDMATEFRDGEATVNINGDFCKIGADGIVKSVDFQRSLERSMKEGEAESTGIKK